MTSEQLVGYLDAAVDRLRRDARAAFETAVETGRLATIYAYNAKAYRAWRSRKRVAGDARPRGLSGANLERVLSGLALTNPDIVRVVHA